MSKSESSKSVVQSVPNPFPESLGKIPDASYLAYYQPTPRPFLLLTSGHFPAGTKTSPHHHSCVALHGCLEGPLVLRTSNDEHVLDAGSFVMMASGIRHSWRNPGRQTAASLGLLIETDRPGHWPAGAGVQHCCETLRQMLGPWHRFNVVGDPQLQQSFWLVAERLMSDTVGEPVTMAGVLMTLLGQVCERLQRKSIAAGPLDDARRIRQLLLRRIHDRLRIEEIATEMGVSATRAKELFRNVFGCGIIHYFNQLKIVHAKRLLCNPSLTIEEISQKLGFARPGYFTRVFYQYTGETPRDFRSHPPDTVWQ